MDDTNPTTMPPPQNQNAGQPPIMPEMPEKKYGPMIGIVIIIALIVLGGLYFWGAELAQREADTQMAPQGDPVLEQLESQSSSDDLNAIEADLNANDLQDLDQGLDDLEADLQVQ